MAKHGNLKKAKQLTFTETNEIPRRCDEKMTMIRYENGDNPCLIHKGNIETFGLDTMNNPQKSISGDTIILSLHLNINLRPIEENIHSSQAFRVKHKSTYMRHY